MLLTYGDREFTWNTGRNLESIVDGENEYSYTYDENDIRTSKTVNGVTTYFNTRDGVILSQTDGTNTMYFQYDTNGTPLGFIYNGTQYLYLTNIMGDVISITDAQGNEIAQYEYDAWGGIASISSIGDLESGIVLANANPIRYRGYYFDSETGYYYLQSRYYDPSICRFINADVPEIAEISKDIIDGMNLFAYCSDNPVNNSDPSGYINWDLEFARASIVSSVLSALGTIAVIAFKKTPWGRLMSAVITLAAISSNVYSYAKAIKSAKSYYGKYSSKFKSLKRYNNVMLMVSVACVIVSDILSARFVRNYATVIALALLGCRTVTIVGLSINIGEFLSGRNVIYKSRLWR